LLVKPPPRNVSLGSDRFAMFNKERDIPTDVDKDLYWRANIGFHSPEFTPDTTSFWVSAHCSSQYFDDLLTAVRRGHVDNILVGMETTMWTKGRPWRTWHLGPPTDGKAGDDPAMAEGYISSLIWEEKFNSQSANVVAAPKPQLVELPARVYSMLTALLAMVAALLVLTFLR
jgi:hypothetical protein